MRAAVTGGENVVSIATDHWSHDDRTAVGVVATYVTSTWRRETDVIGLVSTGDERVTADTLATVTQAVLDYVLDNDASLRSAPLTPTRPR